VYTVSSPSGSHGGRISSEHKRVGNENEKQHEQAIKCLLKFRMAYGDTMTSHGTVTSFLNFPINGRSCVDESLKTTLACNKTPHTNKFEKI